MKSNLRFLPLEAFRPREVDGPGGEEGAARQDEGAPLEEGPAPEDDAPGADMGAYAPGKGPEAGITGLWLPM